MRRHRPFHFLILSALAFAALDGRELVAQSEVTTYTPSQIKWKEVYYKASKMGVKAKSEVTIRLVPTAEAAKTLIEVEGGHAVMPTGDQVAEIVIRTLVKGSEGESTILLDPMTAAAYQRSQVSKGKKEEDTFFRIYRYTDDGVFVERRFPKGSKGSPWTWPVNNTRKIPFAAGSGKNVTEAMALFYILSAADFKQVGDKLRFTNFDRDGMSEVVMTVAEMVPWNVNYTEVSAAGERQVKEKHQVARLTISGKSVGGGESDFEFLGLRGKIEIFADPELRIPVAVRGKVPVAGKMTVEINRVVIE